MTKLKVMCARSMHEVVTALAYAFTRTTGQEIELSFGTVGALQKRLDSGETADVLITATAAVDDMVQAGILATRSTPIAITSVGVAVRDADDADLPDISTSEAFCRMVRDARSIAFSDAFVGGTAGVYLARMFEELGFAEMIKAKGRPQASGGEVAARVASGEVDIGMTLVAEIVPVKGARVLGTLPNPLGCDASYSGVVMAASGIPDVGATFIQALAHPDARPVWQAAGFELPSPSRTATAG